MRTGSCGQNGLLLDAPLPWPCGRACQVAHPPLLLCCRCEALEARCLALEQQAQQLGEQLATEEGEREVVATKQAALQGQLAEAQLSVAQLEAQQETFQSVQQVGQRALPVNPSVPAYEQQPMLARVLLMSS